MTDAEVLELFTQAYTSHALPREVTVLHLEFCEICDHLEDDCTCPTEPEF